MARLIDGGFELNSTSAGVEFTTITNGTISSTTFRTGAFAGRISSLASATARGFEYQFASAAGNGAYFLRTYINFTTLPSAANTIIAFSATTGLIGTIAASIKVDNTGAFTLFNNVTQVGSASSTIATGGWHYVEMWFDKSGGVGAGILKGRLDGVEFASATNLTIANGALSFTFGGNLSVEAQTTGDWFFDDYALNDATGSFQTTYPGAASNNRYLPNAGGDAAAWTRGGTNSGANWSQVDEVTPNDITDYNKTSSNNVEDLLNMTNTGSEISASDTINVIAVGARFRGEQASGNRQFKLEIEASSGGTIEQSATISPGSSTWHSNADATPFNYSLVLYDLPGASTTPWTKADIDAGQAGYKSNTTGANASDITDIWFAVDSTPNNFVWQQLMENNNPYPDKSEIVSY